MMNHPPRRSKALAFIQNSLFSFGFRFGVLSLAFLPLMACSTLPESSNPDSAGAGMVVLAEQLAGRGDYVGATPFYQRAIAQDSSNVSAHKGLAVAFEKTGYTASAIEEYRAIANLNPKDGEAYRQLGRLYLSQEKPADARDAYRAALAIDDDDAKAMNGLGVALDYLGDHGGAQGQFKNALKEDSGNLATINNLGYSYIKDGKVKEAIALLEPHIKARGATAALRQNLALAYGLAGMDLDAERVAKMDLPAAKVKENLEYYKRMRAERAVDTAPYAEVGTYATEALAEAEIAKMQAHLDEAGIDLKPIIAPQVGAPGGTPRFEVRMMGCAKPSDVNVFCSTLAKKGLPCMVRNGG